MDRYAAGEATDLAVNDDAPGLIARQTTAIVGGPSSLFTIAVTTGADGGTLASGGTLSLHDGRASVDARDGGGIVASLWLPLGTPGQRPRR